MSNFWSCVIVVLIIYFIFFRKKNKGAKKIEQPQTTTEPVIPRYVKPKGTVSLPSDLKATQTKPKHMGASSKTRSKLADPKPLYKDTRFTFNKKLWMGPELQLGKHIRVTNPKFKEEPRKNAKPWHYLMDGDEVLIKTNAQHWGIYNFIENGIKCEVKNLEIWQDFGEEFCRVKATVQLLPLQLDGLICLDTETTGVIPDKDEILTLSIADGYGNQLFEGMFKPSRKRSWAEAQKVNGISPEMVKDCPRIKEKREEIQAILDDATEILGYNVEFDCRFLDAAGLNVDWGKIEHEPMKDFAKIYGQKSDWGDWKWQKLTTAADAIGYKWVKTPHSSMGDVLATLALAKWLYGTNEAQTSSSSEDTL